MGRWAQARRKGGGGAPPLLPVTILDVIEQDGNNVHVVFDRPVTFINSFTHDGAFNVAGVEPNDGVQVDTVTISVGVPGTNSGDGWALISQPSWLLEPAPVPQSGVVT